MEKTVVMTLRLPVAVADGIERLAARSGHKPAQVSARLVEEGLRRQNYPHIDLRATPAGRVAYISGTRLAVHFVSESIQGGLSPEEFATEYNLPVGRVRMALAYASEFSREIEAARAYGESNMEWIKHQDAAHKSLAKRSSTKMRLKISG